jgi:ribosomal protein L18
METALQELIKELIIELRSKYDYLLLTITEREEHKTHGEIFALNAAIILAKTKLPKEREQIEQAYKTGWDFGYKHVSQPASQYYETNFNTNKV